MELAVTLYAHPRLHSRDSEAVRDFLRGKQLDFEVLGRGASRVPLDTHINALYMPDGSYLGYVQYGAAAQTRSGAAAGDYRLQFALEGGCEITLGNRRYACAGSDAVVTSPGRPHGLRLSADCKRVLAVFSRDALASTLKSQHIR